ncbi:MAG: hypothetical protein JKY94_00360 [Rhodobacteraceae bacterium]|nr:hypothetical protein [Paracoccaceae bacterium]
MFYFDEFLERQGLDLMFTRLLRHDARGLMAWQRGGAQTFGCFASFQRYDPSPYQGAQLACQFIPGPTLAHGEATALFVGITRIIDQWDWDGVRLPTIQDEDVIAGERGRQDIDAFDLEWIDEGLAFSERILIRWRPPAATRAWTLCGDRNSNQILELRIDPR